MENDEFLKPDIKIPPKSLESIGYSNVLTP